MRRNKHVQHMRTPLPKYSPSLCCVQLRSGAEGSGTSPGPHLPPDPDPPPCVVSPLSTCSFLEHLHKHQGSVLHPDYKTAFPSFEDALHRLLPYHVYQGALPSPNDYHKGEASPGHSLKCPGGPQAVGRGTASVEL